MTTYAWPTAFKPATFEMRVEPNQRIFQSAFNPASAQVVDVGGEFWVCTMTIPVGTSDASGSALEAFLNRLRGWSNFVSLYHQKRIRPRGTISSGTNASWTTTVPSAANWSTSGAVAATWTAGYPYVKNAIAQFATSGTLYMLPGYTLEPGDLFAFSTGQVVQYVGSTTLTADGAGEMVVEFAPSARTAIPAFSAISFDRPQISFRLRDGKAPPVSWVPGGYQIVTLDLVEAI